MGWNLAKIHGQLGAEKVLIEKFRKAGIKKFSTLEEIEDHIATSDQVIEKVREQKKRDLQTQISQLKSLKEKMLSERLRKRVKRKKKLQQELDNLKSQIQETLPSTLNPFKWLYLRVRRVLRKRRKNTLEQHFVRELDKPFRGLEKEITRIQSTYRNYEDNFDNIIHRQMMPHMRAKQRIDAAIKQFSNWISGARGELETVESLVELPDDYYVFNDVYLELQPPLHRNGETRFACQADHVVVGPTGVFNIESKNWNANSIENRDLRSPIEQVRTTGTAIFREFNRAVENGRIGIRKHHWGDRKIRVRNVVSMADAMPDIEFQYVKILPTDQLKGYVSWFDSEFSKDEVEVMASWWAKRMD